MTPFLSRDDLPMQLKLPYPWHTSYTIKVGAFDEGLRQFQIEARAPTANAVHQQLHKDDLHWTEPKFETAEDKTHDPAKFWARHESAPTSRFFWTENRPSIGQFWLATYSLVTLYPRTDSFHIQLQGERADELGDELCRVGLLAKSHPVESTAGYVLFRGSFWQGAGSPFGSRPVWLAEATQSDWEFPPLPLQKAQIGDQSEGSILTTVRPQKPEPGSIIYSRHVPHLRSQLSFQVLDHENKDQLNLFHSWNRHGTEDYHHQYLQAVHKDPTTIPILAKRGDTFFAYFEVYWVKERVEDDIGVHFNAGTFDRGCNVLFPEAALSDEKTLSALWGSIVHYLFLDEPRTMNVFGAPRYIDSMLVGYEAQFPFNFTRRVDTPTGEAALALCSRELFFQICPFAYEFEAPEFSNAGKNIAAKL